MNSTLRVGVIGAGVMGSAHARVVNSSPRTELAFVVDPDGARAEQVANRLGVPWSIDLANFDGCDAVVVATATEHHLEWTIRALEADRPVLVEKPLSNQIGEARKIVVLATERGLPLMCGLLERYNPAFVALRGV